MGIKKQKAPNKLGLILIGLSRNKIFPVGKHIKPADKTAITKLRKVLYNWTGLKNDPFHPYNPSDGWKPKFKLIYDIHNADIRAKEKAEKTMVSFDDPRRKKKLYDTGVYQNNDNVGDDFDDFNDSDNEPKELDFN